MGGRRERKRKRKRGVKPLHCIFLELKEIPLVGASLCFWRE